MSETEHNKGILTPVEIIGDIENTAKKILEGMGEDPEEYYSTFLEQLEDVGYRKFFIADNMIYNVESTQIDPDNSIMLASKCGDGRIYFETKFYNGGCSFNEALHSAISRIKED